jgi:integrase
MDRKKYLDADEVRRLRTVTEAQAITDTQHGRVAGPLAWIVVDLALSTGLRVSELAAIRVADIDLKREILTVTRRKKRQAKPESLNIGSDLATHLRAYLDWRKTADRQGDTLLIGKRGALSPEGIAAVWEKAVARAGLPAEYTAHSARHTCATHLLARTHDLRQVQKQLGHSSPTVTANMYADVSDERMKAGVEGLYG